MPRNLPGAPVQVLNTQSAFIDAETTVVAAGTNLSINVGLNERSLWKGIAPTWTNLAICFDTFSRAPGLATSFQSSTGLARPVIQNPIQTTKVVPSVDSIYDPVFAFTVLTSLNAIVSTLFSLVPLSWTCCRSFLLELIKLCKVFQHSLIKLAQVHLSSLPTFFLLLLRILNLPWLLQLVVALSVRLFCHLSVCVGSDKRQFCCHCANSGLLAVC